jgi:hypothetical protein
MEKELLQHGLGRFKYKPVISLKLSQCKIFLFRKEVFPYVRILLTNTVSNWNILLT